MFTWIHSLLFKKRQKNSPIFSHSDDDFGAVLVTDEEGIRYLKFGNRTKQGAMDLSSPDTAYFEYQQAMLSVFDDGAFERCLCLGLGAGSMPKFIHQNGLCQSIDVVEINPVVIDVARAHFQLPKEVTVHNADALDFVVGTRMVYDLVMVDLFNKSGTPINFKLLSFYKRLKRVVRSGGVVVVNMWASDFGDLLLEEKLRTVFDEVEVMKVSRNHITICKRVT